MIDTVGALATQHFPSRWHRVEWPDDRRLPVSGDTIQLHDRFGPYDVVVERVWFRTVKPSEIGEADLCQSDVRIYGRPT